MSNAAQDSLEQLSQLTESAAFDQRAAPRFTLLIRAAKLLTQTAEYLCVIRDVSAHGVSVRIFHPLPEGQTLILELPNGDRHGLDTVWEEEGAAGFRFTDPVDVDRLVENKGRFSKRPVRLQMELPASISYHGQSADVIIHNLSQQGALIDCPMRLPIDARLRLEGDRLPNIEARVRWRKDAEYGLVFDDTFQFAELAKIAARLQDKCNVDCGNWQKSAT